MLHHSRNLLSAKTGDHVYLSKTEDFEIDRDQPNLKLFSQSHHTNTKPSGTAYHYQFEIHLHHVLSAVWVLGMAKAVIFCRSVFSSLSKTGRHTNGSLATTEYQQECVVNIDGL